MQSYPGHSGYGYFQACVAFGTTFFNYIYFIVNTIRLELKII